MRERSGFIRRMRLSTGRVIVTGGIIALFVVVFSYTTAWGFYMDRVEKAASARMFQGKEFATVLGDTFSTEELKNTDVTAVNIWATTCHSCIE